MTAKSEGLMSDRRSTECEAGEHSTCSGYVYLLDDEEDNCQCPCHKVMPGPPRLLMLGDTVDLG